MSSLTLRRHSRGLGLSPRRRATKGAGLPTVVQTGLVAEWRFDEGAGQVLTDYTGNGHNGRLGNTTGADAADPTWTAEGLSFDGGDYVECDDVGISGGVARSVVLAVKANASTSGNQFAAEWRGFGSQGQRLTIKTGGGNELRTEYQLGGFQTPALVVAPSTWNFVAYTLSSSNANTGVLYLNGNSAPVTLNLQLDTRNNFYWGTSSAVPLAMIAAYGLVYNRALSPAEVEQNRQTLQVILAPRGIALP